MIDEVSTTTRRSPDSADVAVNERVTVTGDDDVVLSAAGSDAGVGFRAACADVPATCAKMLDKCLAEVVSEIKRTNDRFVE